MAEIPVKAMASFGETGGILGMIIWALIVLVVFILYGAYWYIKTQRLHEATQSKFHADQYERRLAVEKELADAMNLLVMTIRGRPCQKGSTEVFAAQGTRRLERGAS